jgi:tetraacyldisaccharide 4'-kinase
LAHQPSSFESTLTRSWSRRGPLACALWPLSLLFGALAAVRRAVYARGWLRVARVPVPVIIVGNVYVGGTGKTPLTIWLVEAMRAAGYRPGVISRGYGAQASAIRPVKPTSSAAEVGDEPLLIARRTGVPLMVGRDRVAAAQALIAAYPDVNLIISDDGLQHYRLARDIEIVLSDARGEGNGWLLPAGPLREATTRRRDFSVINGLTAGSSQSCSFGMELRGGFAERLTHRSERVALNELPRVRTLAAAGIGHPGRFFTQLRAAGLEFAELPLPDHFSYAENPFVEGEAELILITEKDAVKCAEHAALKNDPRIWVVPVDAHIAAALAEQIVEKLRGYPTA